MSNFGKLAHLRVVVLVLLLGLLAAACGDDEVTPVEGAAVPVTEGPFGETPTPSAEVSLTEAETTQVRDGGYTAALLWHTAAAFTDAVSNGAKDALAELGIEVVAETNSEFDAEQQANDVETVLALDPDIILTLVHNPAAFGPAVDAGVQLVLLSNPIPDLVAGQDYVGIVTDDLAQIGIAAADVMAESLGGEGDVGFIFHDADYYVTNQRDQSFKAWLNNAYPDIDIVEEQGLSGDFAVSAEEITTAMLTRNPDIDGIYAPWSDGPGDGVLAALRAAGNDNVGVVSVDLGTNVALDLAQEGNMVGIVADEAYEIGRTMAVKGAYGLIGKAAPPFTVVPAFKVTADTLEEGYERSFRADPPQVILEALEG